jgi:LysM repeat protein
MTQPIKQLVELATIWWRQSRIAKVLDKTNGDIQRLEREVDRFGRVLNSCDIEINDYEGRKNNNLNVETAAIEVDADVKEEIIFETIKPEIKYKGEIQQKSRVVVHKPAEGDAPESISIKKPDSPKGEPATNEDENSANNGTSKSDPDASRHARMLKAGFVWLVVLSCAIIVVAVVVPLSFTDSAKDNDGIIDELHQVIEEKDAIIDDQADRISELKEIDSTSGEIPSAAQQSAPDDGTDIDSEDVVSLKRYTVKAGDTLFSICEDNNLDYAENAQFIQNANGIENPNIIFAGQVIYLPKQKLYQ